jgi:hypothetical protein
VVHGPYPSQTDAVMALLFSRYDGVKV